MEENKLKKLNEALYEIGELDKLLTDRISDLHEVKMGMESRHTFILYRDRLWRIRDKCREAITQIEEREKQ